MILETKKVFFDEPLYLESGRVLKPFEVVYETYGTLNSDKSNVILITHALSGSHHVAGTLRVNEKLDGGMVLLAMVKLLTLQNSL